MAITTLKDILASGLIFQGDARDPLGIWGGATSQVNSGSGGSTRITFRVGTTDSNLSSVFAISGLSVLQESGTPRSDLVKFRMFTNWPSVDFQAAITPFNSAHAAVFVGSTLFTGGVAVAPFNDTVPAIRGLLSWDPRGLSQPLLLCEFEMANISGTTVLVSVQGYFWDRAVLNTPGGPRFPLAPAI